MENVLVSQIRRVVLDVLKPHEPSILEFAKRLSNLKGIDGVNCMLEEVDQATETIKIIIEGPNIKFDLVQNTIKDCGGAIHSVDSVSSGKKLVENVKTPQD